MKKATTYVKIALLLIKIKVEGLLIFAKGIKGTIAIDKEIEIDMDVQKNLNQAIIDLDATVVIRKTDKSTAMTKKEGNQSTALILILQDIADSTEKQANAISPGDVPAIEEIILRIGFKLFKTRFVTGRIFEIFKKVIGGVSIRVKALKPGTTYYWRWSPDKITWTTLQTTQSSSVRITGLPSDIRVYFQSATTPPQSRVPVLDAAGFEPEWSDSISAMIP